MSIYGLIAGLLLSYVLTGSNIILLLGCPVPYCNEIESAIMGENTCLVEESNVLRIYGRKNVYEVNVFDGKPKQNKFKRLSFYIPSLQKYQMKRLNETSKIETFQIMDGSRLYDLVEKEFEKNH